eukprot:1138880-Pelagomonas_calceolata.AAC.5
MGVCSVRLMPKVKAFNPRQGSRHNSRGACHQCHKPGRVNTKQEAQTISSGGLPQSGKPTQGPFHEGFRHAGGRAPSKGDYILQCISKQARSNTSRHPGKHVALAVYGNKAYGARPHITWTKWRSATLSRDTSHIILQGMFSRDISLIILWAVLHVCTEMISQPQNDVVILLLEM